MIMIMIMINTIFFFFTFIFAIAAGNIVALQPNIAPAGYLCPSSSIRSKALSRSRSKTSSMRI
jgi:hypothetical protein